MKRLAILGASGHGKVVADCAECSGWEDIVFFDDAWPELQRNGQWTVAGDRHTLFNSLDVFEGVIVAIGNNATRWNMQQTLFAKDARLVSIVHPQSTLSRHVDLGVGSVVMAGAVINIDCQIGECCIVNTGATLDHDCILGDAVHISPGVNVAGGVRVGRETWVGIGTSVRELVEIGENVMIGAGSVVVTNIPNAVTALGQPARTISR